MDNNQISKDDFRAKLELASSNQESLWQGTFADFLRLYETSNNKNLGITSHQRVENAILASGTEIVDYFGQKRIRYNFFENDMFGAEQSIDGVMSYIHAAARRTETSRRMLLIYGPPSSGKSQLCSMIKRGLECYSRSKDGAVFAVKGSKMHENPFLLVPKHLRDEFQKHYGVLIEGDLSPHTQWRLDNEYLGKFMNFPIEQIILSEAGRVGIGTWASGDPKCLTEDCTILTKNGLVKGSDLFADSLEKKHEYQVATMDDSFAPIKNCFDNGVRTVYEIQARGMSIEATENHRFVCVNENGDFEFVYVKDIVGRLMPIKVGSQIFGTGQDLLLPEADCDDDTVLPRQLNSNLSKLVGCLLQQSPIRVDFPCGSLQVSFSALNSSLNAEVGQIIREEFCLEPEIYSSTKMVRTGGVLTAQVFQDGMRVLNRRFVDFINLNFGVDKLDQQKEIPSVILCASREHQLAFLEGLFTSHSRLYIDEETNKAEISYHSQSKKLINQLQSMFINLGAYGFVDTLKSNNPSFPASEILEYRICFSGFDAQLVADLLPAFMKLHGKEIPNQNFSNDESVVSLSGLISEIGTLTGKTATKDTTRQLLIECMNHLTESDCNAIKKENLINKISKLLHYRLIKVISKKRVGFKQVFDIEVDSKNHDFIVNGLISHNSQDQTELTGSLDFAKIQEYGDEADPRTFNFNGELNVANRGMVEFIEGLRAEEKFLRILLIATQEKSIKAPRFGLISVDCLIVMHCNEEEFDNFMGDKRYKAYHDRMVVVRAPYNLGVNNEVKIYNKLLASSDISHFHIAPHSLHAAAIFAVLTRLEPVEGSSLIKKMKLYDGQSVKGMKPEQVLDMQKRSPKEGMSGISPRFVIDQINIAISKAIGDDRKFVTALDILRQLSIGISTRDCFKPEEKNRYKEHIDMARQEFNELLRNDIQKAFFLSFDNEARTLCSKYLDQIDASLSNSKPRDPVTNEEIEINENLMESIESHLDVSSSGKHDFRNEVMRHFGNAALKGKKVDYTSHSGLREAIQKQLFAERQGVIRMTVSTRNPDSDELRRLNDVVDRMVTQQNYTAESANELLKYAAAHLFEKV